jgi:hypothetical protein
MAARSSKRQPFAVTFIETSAMGGAAVGLLIVSSTATHQHAAAHPCPTARQVATCIGQATNRALMSLLTGAIAGLLIGGVLALGALYLWRALSRQARAPTRLTAGGGATVALARFGAARKTAAPPNGFRRKPIPERVRHEVWRRDQGACVDCGGREQLEFDHIIPVSRGGSNTVRNIELRCEDCNGRKAARI